VLMEERRLELAQSARPMSFLFKAVLRSLRKILTTNATTRPATRLPKLTIAVMNDRFFIRLRA